MYIRGNESVPTETRDMPSPLNHYLKYVTFSRNECVCQSVLTYGKTPVFVTNARVLPHNDLT